MATIIVLKRGSNQDWEENNYTLFEGEAGYEIDTGRLKIGDGKTPWKELKYQDENSLYTASTKLDFPDKGNSYTLYKASDEQRLYQWNQELNRYEAILTSEGGSDPVVDIQIIYGGNAHGNN